MLTLKGFGNPEQALKNEIEGKVFVQFIMSKDGLTFRPRVIRGLTKVTNEEGKRVIKNMPQWEPG